MRRKLKPRADGRFQITVTWKEGSASRRKVVYGHSQREAEENEAALKRRIEEGQRINAGDCTVSEWAEEWLRTYKEPNVGEKTMEGYTRNVALLTDAIGYKSLKDVRLGDLQRILNARSKLSGSAIRKTAMTLRAVFKAAAVNRMIPFSPAEGLHVPRQVDGTHRALTRMEIERICGAASAMDIQTRKPHRFALPVMLMLYAGLRRGEVAAFVVERDADLQAGNITVSRSVSYATNKPELKAPKSEAGKRTLPIFPPLRPFLEGRRGYAAMPSTSPQARKIREKAGKPITLEAYRKAFADFMQLAGVDCTSHDLRHTWFTMLYDMGVDVKTAQRWGGHASAAMTMEIYTHLSAERESASRKLVESYFGGSVNSDIDSQKRV